MTSQIITLTTDFGYRDPFVGIMKGVMLRINPTARFVDLTHGIEPQDVVAGALSLAASVPYFQRGTVHLAVVDPGVGSKRKPIVIETKDAFYVGPDNGVLSLAAQESAVIRTVELSNTDYHLQPTSSTFHGRDIFSPAAARIAMGKPAKDLGHPLDGFTSLAWPAIERHGHALVGKVIYVDRFGNLITNIRRTDLGPISRDVAITVQDTTIREIASSYRIAGTNNYVAIFNSWDLLEIARCNGNAHRDLGARVGASVIITGDKVY